MDLLEDLPPAGKPGRPVDAELAQFASELKANVGMWAPWPREMTDTTRRTVPTNLRAGRYASLPPDEFEAVQRDRVVYVRAKP